MDVRGRRKKFARRTRTSCLECRSAHRKCDESRPACARCHQLVQPCTYGLRISWRPCLVSSRPDSGPQLDEQPVRPAARLKRHSDYQPQRRSQQRPQQLLSLSATHMSLFPGLSPAHRSLLAYFSHTADSFSGDHAVKDRLCGVFVPMAAESTPLMTAVLALSAVHRANNTVLFQDARELSTLQLASVRQLRLSLSKAPDETVIATSLMLCFAQVVSGGGSGGDGSSWRLHLEGLESVFALNPFAWSVHSSSPSRALISKCFVSLAALASVSCHPPSCLVSQRALDMLGGDVTRLPVDDFIAYSSELMQVFFESGDILRKVQARLSSTAEGMDEMLARRTSRLLRRLGRMAAVSRTEMDYSNPDHQNVDRLFHLAAMLHINQRIKRLSPSSAEVQRLTVQILGLLRGIKLQDGPSIGVFLFFPAFTAGNASVKDIHRQQVRDVLNGLIRKMGFSNLRQGLGVLEAIWAHRDRHGESNVNVSWEGFAHGADVILY